MLRADLVAAGLPLIDADGHGFQFHSFRHTCATWLVQQGVQLIDVAAVTGHSNLAILAGGACVGKIRLGPTD